MQTRVIDYLPDAIPALIEQLKQDETRWHDTWLKRTRKGQEDRTYQDFARYYTEWLRDHKPIPWLKIIGDALICWIRDQHPEMWPE